MQVDSVQKINFKAAQFKKNKTPASEAAQLYEVMEKQGYHSIPVSIGAIAGFAIGGLVGAIRHKNATSAIFNAMCFGGAGIIIGRVVNFVKDKMQNTSNK